MSLGNYRIDLRPPGDLIISTLAGFFTVAQVAAYAEEMEALIARYTLAHGGYRILIDISHCAIQAQEVTAAFGQHVARVRPSRRVAVVTGSSMTRIQVRRIVGRPELAVFECMADALAWVDGLPTEHAA